MGDRTSDLESRIEGLSRALSELERRVRAMESREGPAPTANGPIGAAAVGASGAEITGPELSGGVALLGRSLVVLGGAYLLRAATSSGFLPEAIGVGAGLLYAALWVVWADHAARAARPLSASFHAAAAAAIGFPLLVEATSRFGILSPAGAAGLSGALTASFLWSFWRRNLEPLAWIGSIGAIAAGVALVALTRSLLPVVVLWVAVGAGTLWLAPARSALPWVAAGFADAIASVMVLGISIGKSDIFPGSAVFVLLALFAIYLGTISGRVLTEHREVSVFELTQGGIALLLGYGGAVSLASEGISLGLGVAGMLLASGFYAVALRRLPIASERSYLFFTSSALGIVLIGTKALFDQPAYLLSVLAVLGAGAGARIEKPIFSFHASLCLLVASLFSGLLVQGAYGFLASPAASWPALEPVETAVLLGAIFISAVPVGESRLWWSVPLARLLPLMILLWGGGGVVLSSLQSAVGEPSRFATLRTAFLAGAAVLLGWLSNRARFRHASVLVYPVLVAAGTKLAIEDFPKGGAGTLFLALAVYGAALILAPRLASRP